MGTTTIIAPSIKLFKKLDNDEVIDIYPLNNMTIKFLLMR